MTDLSPREKALVEAVREIVHDYGDTMSGSGLYEQFEKALRAYDPPKPKIPVLPPWEELLSLEGVQIADFNDPPETISIGWCLVRKEQYEAIRTLTSKEQE
jgi:hypothetical protein